MESFRESMLHLIALAFFMAVIAVALAINTIMQALPWIILAAGVSVALVLVARGPMPDGLKRGPRWSDCLPRMMI